MGEGDHQLPVFDSDEGDRLPETGRQQLQKFTIAAMLGKRTEPMGIDKGSKKRLRGFHAAIIASLLLGLALAGCGYKTDPVYVSPLDHNRTEGSR